MYTNKYNKKQVDALIKAILLNEMLWAMEHPLPLVDDEEEEEEDED